MKIVALLFFLGAAIAAPQTGKLYYRNLYKKPLTEASPHNGRIINGNVAKPHSIPYQAFLEIYDKNGGWYCGGSLISPSVVLTAGHCAYEAVEGTITLGAQRPLEAESTQLVVTSKKFIVHERFNYNMILNDIALIILSQSIQTNQYVSVVPLPSPSNIGDSYEGKTAIVSGWGLTKSGVHILSDELRYTQNSIISNNDCGRVYGDIPDYQVCLSGDGHHGVCSGDSGGPLTVDGVQIGVVSYSAKDCDGGFPSGFTRTTSFLDWIQQHL